LLLDEDVRPLLAETLRARGFDAIHLNELGLSGSGDAAVLRAAAAP
jgi:predicted nuclease of predicted toxin-antitoxin system